MTPPDKAAADLRDHVSLRRIAYILPRYRPPEGEFEPARSWAAEYTHYSLGYWHFRRQGYLRIEKERKGDGAAFSFDCMRAGRNGLNHYVRAEVVTGDDPLCIPRAWTMEAKLATSPDAAPYLLSGIRKSARFRNGTLTVTCNGDSETKVIPGAYTCKWCLIEAVQRMTGASTKAYAFSLVDEFDEVRHRQTLACRASEMVPLKGEPRQLTAYEHLGEGVIPTVYWVDEAGRALFVVTGVEVFALTRANGVAVDFDDRPLHGQSLKKLLGEEA